MGVAANTNLVHEAEAQRQHARIKLPAKLKLKLQDGKFHRFLIKDISAGGFSLNVPSLDLKPNSQHEASLVFNIDALEFQFNISFLVKSNDDGLIGCEFQNLSTQDISTLRFMITSHLSGEFISMGDVINTLSRQNFTKSRNNKSNLTAMSGFARVKSIVISLAIFLVGLGATGFIANKLYSNYFNTYAETAVIKIHTIDVTMPRNGKPHSLIPEDGIVKFGIPIASYETAMLDALKGHLDNESLTEENIASLFNQSLSGTISSPCDCRLQKQITSDGQFVSKGSTVFQLVPVNEKPFIEARFSFNDSQSIVPGQSVDITIPGLEHSITGNISDVTVSNSGTSLLAIIQPQETIESHFNGRPVSVVLNGLTSNKSTTTIAGLAGE